MSLLISIFLWIFLPNNAPAEPLSQDRAETFIKSVIFEDHNLESYADLKELLIAKRLGIQYSGVYDKFMISYDINEMIKNLIRTKQIQYSVKVIDLGDTYSKIEFKVPDQNYQIEYYFNDDFLISPVSYYTAKWARFDSEHFTFVLSDTTLFNTYCIENLENYYTRISGLMKFSELDHKTIQANKIYYILCRDELEVEKLTGFRARGMYNLAYDYIITTFNAHYHELIHLLINYKLRNLQLYTHPFFQEGLAVAFGGRGGFEPDIMLHHGLFLQKSDMQNYSDLLTRKDFFSVDVSLSYPVSGLYNYFLVEHCGFADYIKLYAKYSGTANEVDRMQISKSDLPDETEWHEFLDKFSKNLPIEFEPSKVKTPLIFYNESASIFEDYLRYYFNNKDILLLVTDSKYRHYHSKQFHETFNDKQYNGEKYLIISNANEISIYNLYTNNLIAKYVSSFAIPMKTVPSHEGYFRFGVRKDIFDEKLREIFLSND